MKSTMLAMACGGFLLLSAAVFAAEPIPADPTGKNNQMMTDCMTKQDPAMNKEDAIQACKDKMKQGAKVDKPAKPDKADKPRDKPAESPQK
jgi:hypothetical protein